MRHSDFKGFTACSLTSVEQHEVESSLILPGLPKCFHQPNHKGFVGAGHYSRARPPIWCRSLKSFACGHTICISWCGTLSDRAMRCGSQANEEWVPNEGGKMAERIGPAGIQACGQVFCVCVGRSQFQTEI
jgi:hypothetical protein